MEQFSAYNNPNLVILDSGAQLSIFFNKNALVELHQVDPIFRGGINSTEKSVVCDQAGYLPNLKNILIYYNPEVKKNILKFSEMNEKYAINWMPKLKQFICEDDNEDEIIFKELFGVYCNILDQISLSTEEIPTEEIPIHKTKSLRVSP